VADRFESLSLDRRVAPLTTRQSRISPAQPFAHAFAPAKSLFQDADGAMPDLLQPDSTRACLQPRSGLETQSIWMEHGRFGQFDAPPSFTRTMACPSDPSIDSSRRVFVYACSRLPPPIRRPGVVPGTGQEKFLRTSGTCAAAMPCALLLGTERRVRAASVVPDVRVRLRISSFVRLRFVRSRMARAPVASEPVDSSHTTEIQSRRNRHDRRFFASRDHMRQRGAPRCWAIAALPLANRSHRSEQSLYFQGFASRSRQRTSADEPRDSAPRRTFFIPLVARSCPPTA